MKELECEPDVRQLRRFLKRELGPLVAGDERLRLAKRNKALTEYTFQAIIWDHICRFVGDSWIALIEDSIPVTGQKADVALAKLTKAGEFDLKHGCVALEVKPNGRLKGLKSDLRKLARYVRLMDSPVNFGVLVYLSRSGKYEKSLRSLAQRIGKRKLAIVRVHLKKAWVPESESSSMHRVKEAKAAGSARRARSERA